MTVLSNRIEYIKKREKKIREDIGLVVKIFNYTGTETLAPGAKWDEFRKKWTIPPVKEIITYTEDGLVHWIDQVEFQHLPAGILNIGDCIITLRSETRSYIERAIIDKNNIEITTNESTPTIISVIPIRYHLTDLNTQIEAYCKRI